MLVCLNNRVSSSYLQKADQIKILSRDYKATPNYLKDYPDKTIVLEVPYNIPEDYDLDIQRFKNLASPGQFMLCFASYLNRTARFDHVPFYLGYPIESFSEARAAKAAGSKYIRPSGSIFFKTKALSKLGIPARLTANRAFLSLLPHPDTSIGTFIRPEDVHLYAAALPENTVLEFECDTPKEEEALFRIYWEQHKWPGQMSHIIKDLEVNTLNRLIPDSWCENRLNCGQKCLEGSSCHICPNIHYIADKVLKEYSYEHDPIHDK